MPHQKFFFCFQDILYCQPIQPERSHSANESISDDEHLQNVPLEVNTIFLLHFKYFEFREKSEEILQKSVALGKGYFIECIKPMILPK